MIILFPHDSRIVSTENITWRQYSVNPSDPVLEPDQEWELPRTNLYGSVIKKGDAEYEMFYQCANAIRIGRAISDDGIHWQKPLVNLTDLSNESEGIQLAPNDEENEANHGGEGDDPNNSPVNENAIKTNLVAGLHMPSVMYVDGEAKPYKMFAFGANGYTTLESKDGLSFETLADPAIEFATYKNEHTNKFWGSDVGPCYYDQTNGLESPYVAMTKTYEIDDEHRTRRCVGRSESADLIEWSETRTVWVPGEGEDKVAQQRGFNWADFYGLCPFRYGNGFLGMLWLFEIDHELPTGTNQGKIEVFLATSKDGESWQRLSDEAFIPWDLNFGEEGGMVTTASQPIFDEASIKIYYSDSNYEHGFTEKDFKKKIESPVWLTRCAEIPKERIVGAFSNNGSLLLDMPRGARKMLRLNLDSSKGKVVLTYLKQDEEVGTHDIEGIDDVNVYIEPLGEDIDQIKVTLDCATLYALELI